METCFICNGPLGFLGILGFLIHFRCIDCGMTCNRPVQEDDYIYTERDESIYENYLTTI